MNWNPRNIIFRAILSSCLLLARTEAYASSESVISTSSAERLQTYSPTVAMELGDRSEQLAQAQALYAEAVRLESSHGFIEAQPLYEKVLTLDPSFSVLQWRIAYSYIQKNQPEQALSVVLRGLEANPQSSTLKALSSWIYTLLKQHREAIRVARDVLTQNFEEIYAYRALYESQKALGADSDAQAIIRNSITIPSTKIKFWTDLARVYTELLMQDPQFKKEDLVKPIAPFYEKAISLEPENSEIFKQFGDFLQNAGASDRALTIYQKGLSYQSDDIDLLLRCARIEHRNGKTKEAYRMFEKAYEQRPDFPMLRELMSTIAIQAGDFEKAISLNEELVLRNSKMESAHRHLLTLYEQTHQNERAIGFYERLMEAGLQNDIVLDTLDDYYQKLALYSRGIEFLEKWVEDRPQEIRPFAILTNYYEKLQILDQKIVFFQNLSKKYPKELNLYSIMTLLYERMNRPEEATKIYEKILVDFPEDQNIVENYLLLLLRQKKFVEAESLTYRLADRINSSVQLRVMQGIILRQLKKYEASMAIFEKLAQQFESDKERSLNVDFYLEWGLTQELADRHELAEKTFLKGLTLAPQDCRLQNALAYLWAEQGNRLEEALVLSQKSLESRPKEGSYIDTLAWIYFKMGRYSESERHLEEARILTKEDPEVLSHLAEVYQKLGRSEEALALWTVVFEKNPEFPKIKEKRLSLQEELKQSKAHVKSSP